MSGSMFHVRYVSVFLCLKSASFIISILNIEFKITFEDIIPLTSLFSIVMYYPLDHN